MSNQPAGRHPQHPPEAQVFSAGQQPYPQQPQQPFQQPHPPMQEQVTMPVANGTVQQPFQQPVQVMDANQVLRSVGTGTQRIIDLRNDGGMREFYATIAETEGFHSQAANIRGKALDTSLTAGFQRLMDHRITVKDVAIVVLGVGVVFLIWEGIAFKFDLPRAGLFDPANPLARVGTTRRAA